MSPPLRYLALGDSYTIGEGVAPEDRWPHQLAARLRAEGVPLQDPTTVAVTGWTTDELAAGLDDAEVADPARGAEGRVAGRYDLVSLLIGVNDQYRGRDPEAYRPAFRALLARAVAFAGGDPARVLVLSIPDWGVTPFAEGRDRARIAREIDAFNEVNREETNAGGARYVDVAPLSRTQGAQVVDDGLHPDGAAYAAWVEAALPEARAALAGDRST
jgi:lysophospholipase L1-like esterase